MKKQRIYILACLIILTVFSSGCLRFSLPEFPVKSVDHANPRKFSRPTPQTRLSKDIVETMELQFPGNNNLIKIGKILSWIRKNFERYRGRGKFVAKYSAQEIYTRRRLSGCNDWGLLLTSILRSLDYPVVFMNAAGIEWAKRYRIDPSVEFSGHTFLEIWIAGKWIVMDSVTGEYIQDYDTNDPIIPIPKTRAGERGYFVYQKGLDHWNMGVRSIKDNEEIMRKFALYYPLDTISIPEKEIRKIFPPKKGGDI